MSGQRSAAGMLAYSKVACFLTFPWMMSLSVVAWGVAGPASPGLGGVAVGGVVVVAEGLGDDGGGCLEDELAQRRGERGAGGNAELAEQRGHGRGVERLPGAAAGEQPPAAGVGGGVHVLPAGD